MRKSSPKVRGRDGALCSFVIEVSRTWKQRGPGLSVVGRDRMSLGVFLDKFGYWICTRSGPCANGSIKPGDGIAGMTCKSNRRTGLQRKTHHSSARARLGLQFVGKRRNNELVSAISARHR